MGIESGYRPHPSRSEKESREGSEDWQKNTTSRTTMRRKRCEPQWSHASPETRERLAAARLVLDFTKSRPASKSEVTIGKAEEFRLRC